MIAYLGFPIFTPDGKVFGALCILNSKANSFPEASENLLLQFRELIEAHLASLLQDLNNVNDDIKNPQRTLSTLISNLPGFVYRCANDPNWTMEYINGDCLNLTGYRNEDIENNRKLSYADLIHPEDQGQVWKDVQKGLNKKEPFKLVYRIISSEGQEKWVWEQGRGVFSETGDLQALEGFVTEITEQKKARQELEKHQNHLEDLVQKRTHELERLNHLLKISTDELKRSNQELEQFATLASHELQEPLRKITTFGSYIKSHSENLDDKCKDYFDRMIKTSEKMRGFIDDLLQLSQVASQARHLQKTNLNKIMEDVLMDLESRITSTHAEIQIGKLPVLKANAFQMKQLFQNILSNSLKFHKDGVAPVIKVRSQLSSNNCMEIIVEDNGIGIRPENSKRIFELFERLHGRGEYEGTGIGLALCKKIVSLHGWEIRVEGLLGQGTNIVISLPKGKEYQEPHAE